jgi:hypothetical protein
MRFEMARGGARPGTGRPAGSKSTATVAREALFDQGLSSVEVDIVVAARGILDATVRLAGPTRTRKLLAAILADIPRVAEPELFDRAAPTSNQSERIAENG